VLGEITINPDEAGRVIVHFDGICLGDVGDRLVLAASDEPAWSANDGNVNVEPVSSDLNTFPFSHTRFYDVGAGSHTFYAVGQNYVETDGSGIGSVYGSLTVEFIPSGSNQITQAIGIQKANQDLSGGPVVLGQISLNAPGAGKVLVHFDGQCVSDVGDLIVLAASDEPDWATNDGNIGVEAYSSDYNRFPFAHSRAYDVGAGNHTFYAIGHNYVETAGSGIASIYGTLRVDFIPFASQHLVYFSGITQTGIDVEGAPVVVAQSTINAPEAGKVKVQFDGQCYADEGDRIVLAASDDPDWGANDGNVTVEAIDSDVDHLSFSHTRVYNVAAGSHTFYAVAENYVETAGDGETSIYGSLTVEYFPQSISASKELAASKALEVFPNPVGNVLTINLPESLTTPTVQVTDAMGRVLRIWNGLAPVNGQLELDVSAFPGGSYFLSIIDQNIRYHASFQRE